MERTINDYMAIGLVEAIKMDWRDYNSAIERNDFVDAGNALDGAISTRKKMDAYIDIGINVGLEAKMEIDRVNAKLTVKFKEAKEATQ